jgi:hypothetical protein
MVGVKWIHMYCVYRRVHFHHVHEFLYLEHGQCSSGRKYPTEIQDLKCRMCPERIIDGTPRYIAHPAADTQIQVDKPLFSRRAPAIARTSRLPTSTLLDMFGLQLFRRLFSHNPFARTKLSILQKSSLVGP